MKDYGPVKCQVHECIHNNEEKSLCQLEVIQIGPDGLGDTDCMSFEPDERKEFK